MVLKKYAYAVSFAVLLLGIYPLSAMATLDNTEQNNAETVLYEIKKVQDVDIPVALLIGQEQTHVIQEEDTLPQLAWKYNVGFVALQAANPKMDAWLPTMGETVLIPSRHMVPDAVHEGIVVNLGEMRLYYFDENRDSPLSFPIGIGREGLNTPSFTSKISRKVEGPTWRPTARMRQLDPSLPEEFPPGEDNPLGTHALYIGSTEYRIHGTSKPLGVGRRVSSGCIRMYPENIITMYGKTAVGTKVTIVNQPIKMGWDNNDLYIEAHPSAKQADEIEFHGRLLSFEWPEGIVEDIRKQAMAKKQDIDWEKVRQVLAERKGIPVQVTVN